MNQSPATKPETFMLSKEQIECLPMEAKQALEQVDDVRDKESGSILRH